MKLNAARGYPQVCHVLPHEKAYLADEAINRVRAKDKYLRASLAREIPALMEQTKPMRRNELTVGRRYGVFGISSFANAVRDGKICQNHGEIYLYIWTFGEDGIFWNENAWGHLEFSAYPCRGEAEGILVEV